MAAISLSARDIEERLQAVSTRLRWRLRVHVALYSLAALGMTVAAAVWFVRCCGKETGLTYVAALTAALIIKLAILVAWQRQRWWSVERVAGWVDRHAQLQQRLETFVALQRNGRSSSLFPVLVLQLLRSLSSTSAKHLVPWQLGKPVGALAVATVVLLLSLMSPHYPALEPPRATVAESTQPRKPSTVPRGLGSREDAATSAAAVSTDSGEGNTATNAVDASETTAANTAADAPVLPSWSRRQRNEPGDRGKNYQGSLGAEESNTSTGSTRTASENAAGTEGVETRGERFAALTQQASSKAGEKRLSTKPTTPSVSAAEALQSARQESRAHNQASRQLPAPSVSHTASSFPHSGNGSSGGAGQAPDAQGLYGTELTHPHGTSLPGNQGEPIVVTLRSYSTVRRGSEPQKAPSKAEGTRNEPNLHASAMPAARLVPIEKPLLPPDYTDIARRLFQRTTKP